MDIEKNFKIILNKLNFRIIAEQSLELCLLIIFTLFAVAYANHEFEIPFFPRGAEPPTIEIDNIPRTAVGSAPEPPANDGAATTLNVINPDDLMISQVNSPAAGTGIENGEQRVQAYAGWTFEYFSNLASVGFALTDTVYNSDADYEYTFAKINLEHAPPNSRNAVSPVMDYILVRDGGRIILHDAAGRIIDADFQNSGLEILHKRDWQGRTVFRRDETEETEERDGSITVEVVSRTHYIFSAASREFVPLWFTDETGDRGADFMYPSYFGISDNEWQIFRHVNNLWGYQSSIDPGRTIAANFTRAFNFSEGFGVAYVTTWTNRERVGSRLYFHDEDGHVVNNSFFGPDPDDTEINRLGFFYFDHGLTRVIRKQLNRAGTAVLSERQHLINRDFREFFTPEDYNIMAYSNGMIMLEKGGRFGFMNHLGEWIAQPIYTYARPFFEGVAVLGMRGDPDRIMLIDRKGNIIAPMQYNHISNCTGGIVAMFEEGVGWTVLNKVRRRIEPS